MNTLAQMTQDQSAALGGVYFLLFIGFIVGVSIFILKKVAPRVHARRRDQEIETAMRMGLRDKLAQDEAARRIVNEYRQQ